MTMDNPTELVEYVKACGRMSRKKENEARIRAEVYENVADEIQGMIDNMKRNAALKPVSA